MAFPKPTISNPNPYTTPYIPRLTITIQHTTIPPYPHVNLPTKLPTNKHSPLQVLQAGQHQSPNTTQHHTPTKPLHLSIHTNNHHCTIHKPVSNPSLSKKITTIPTPKAVANYTKQLLPIHPNNVLVSRPNLTSQNANLSYQHNLHYKTQNVCKIILAPQTPKASISTKASLHKHKQNSVLPHLTSHT